MKYYELKPDTENGQLLKSESPLTLGCVLSGGQAAGGHNVIMGMFDMVKQIHPDSRLIGFLAGPHGVYTGNYMEITHDYMGLYRNMGGFDMIRSGRHKIETPEQFKQALQVCTDLSLDGLAVIGGDDSNTNACLLAEYFLKNNSKCSVIGCPKTIDGDLRNEHIQVSFGFDTATKVYSEAIGNLCTDAESSKMYYYFVRLMGRSASHIALECALRTRINLCLIGEEVEKKQQTLRDITMKVADIIQKRSKRGKDYGVILVPEGLIEFIPEIKVLINEINEILSKEFEGEIEQFVLSKLTEGSRALFNSLPGAISNQLLLDRDPHGNVQVSKIDTERLLIMTTMRELENRRRSGVYSGSFKPQSHFFGYEGRCALPSNFDAQYCYSIGMNAASLMLKKCTGYMSCIKNLQDRDPKNWIAAGCPLPAMMGVERRAGKDKPVITKALVELDGPMFKAYEALRNRWALLDCYHSPGPIQFKSVLRKDGFVGTNFMVSPPDVDSMIYEADVQERYENRHQTDEVLFQQETKLSTFSRARLHDTIEIPAIFRKNSFRLVVSKKYTASNMQVQMKIEEQYELLNQLNQATHFVEIQDKIIAEQGTYHHQEDTVEQMNQYFQSQKPGSVQNKIGIVILGNPAPGMNNIIDGFLKFQSIRKNTTLIGFVNGLEGLLSENMMTICEDSFAPYRNLGGCGYLGMKQEHIPKDDMEKIAEVCKKHNFTSLIVVGATHTLTDAVTLSEAMLKSKSHCGVIAVPSTIEGNIRHGFFQCSLGFDTTSKVYSQLIGNMLTDSASAIKYWYFIRLMGKDPSHLTLECALKTHPNVVIISEESAYRGESLMDIVHRICDVIAERASQGKNYGSVLIPEGLLSHISAYKNLIVELNNLFADCKTSEEQTKLAEKLFLDEQSMREQMTPWSFSLFSTLPEFMRLQLLNEQQISGEVNLSFLETEKLTAHFVAEELKRRKNKGQYSGTFAPVTHFFGYQGRSAHPSLFDCSLGSTLGFGACALAEGGLTGMAVSVKEITQPPSEWRIGGVPIMALLKSQPKSGYRRHELVVPS